ncbi:septum formation protein Maf [Patescibacteria group bacterium]|nr:septum formation protein Maf [Patescibacteria group bacterium]
MQKFSKQIVLASASPRRIELLNELNLDFTTHPSDFNESETSLPAKELVLHNAIGKAQKIARHYKNALIIGVDTVGAFKNHILEKPKDREDAAEILRLLSNTTHSVLSSIAIINTNGGKMVTGIEETFITMDRLSEEDIYGYIDSGEGEDKAAGYAIQGKGALFVKRIEGDYFNVVGLPIFLLRKMLKEFGYKNWF